MRYVFFVAMALGLLVIQTVVVPDLPAMLRFYDFIIPLVVFLSLYRPFGEGLAVVLGAGLMMDMVSGAPIGIYITIYLWLFVGFRRVWRWIRLSGKLLFPLIVIIGVLFENCVFWTAISLQKGMPVLSANAGEIIGFQMLWATVTAPVLLIFFKAVFSRIDAISGAALSENGR
ncbi:MAG: hypothetical protein ACQERN_02665 [Thermodesulfobacteriota bacterium]